MSANLQASTKGEITSKPTTKTGYDRLDINKLYKGKTAEPVAKAVTQKHGMQSLGKALPARRAGASVVVTPEVTSNTETNNSSVPPSHQQQGQPPANIGQQGSSQHQKWTNASHPPPPGPLMGAPSAPPVGPPIHDKSWNGPDVGNYQSQRFAQEFPSLEAGTDLPRSAQPPPSSGVLSSSKSQDNQYGPGPILRPQTEGSWTQGGGRGGPRPPGPPSQNIREPGPERQNLGGPTPLPMSLGQGGHAPPPLGAYPMQYRGMAPPFMYPNGPPPPGGYYPPPRYGMQVPPGAPPPRDHPDSHRDSGRGRGPPPSVRPTQQFAHNPIIKEEDLKRMDDINQEEGSWASVRDEVDYNKKINFSDEEDDKKDNRKSSERSDEDGRQGREFGDKKQIRILERQHSSNDKDLKDRFDSRDQRKSDYDKEDEWARSKSGYESKDRVRRGRDSREEDWRGIRYEDDSRLKKSSSRPDARSADFSGKQFSNLPPRLLRQQQQQNQPYGRRSPSPSERDHREREWDRESDKRQAPPPQYRILERNRGDSESSNNSIREKRGSNDFGGRTHEKDAPREKNHSAESLKEKMDGLDIKNDTSRDEKSMLGRTAKFSTSSWADQVDDEDNLKEIDSYSSRHEVHKEERTVPKRVYIQQRKVENMTANKSDTQPEQKKQAVDSSKSDRMDKLKGATVWGDREEKENKDGGEDYEPKQQRPREIILSEKARQLQHNRDDGRERRSQERDLRGPDRSEGKEKSAERQDDKVWGSRERPRPPRWGSNDHKYDNQTPDRDQTSSGRSGSSDTSKGNKEGDRDRMYAVEKSRSADAVKELPSESQDDRAGREEYGKGKDLDKRAKHSQEDGKGARNRERTGHGVYQPSRGTWKDGRGKCSRGGRDRDGYERPRRNEYDQDRDRTFKEESEDHQQERDSNDEGRNKDITSEEGKKDGGAGDTSKKGAAKSPITSKKHSRGGGSGTARLHGYGPPSDKPFSSASGSGNKEEEIPKEKPAEATRSAASGPVPLMELGDISPPNMLGTRGGRHHGSRGRGIQPRQESYPYRGGSKRGRGDAKPLMSLNSNDLDKHEGDVESEGQEDDGRKAAKKKDGGKGGSYDKHRQGQNDQRTSQKEKYSTDPSNQDPSGNNRTRSGKTSGSDGETHHNANSNKFTGDGTENVDGEGQNRKVSSREKLNSEIKNSRNDKPGLNKDKRVNVKHQPYDAHSRSAMPPRFQKGGSNQTQFSKGSDVGSNSSKETSGETLTALSGWEKTPGGAPKPEGSSQHTSLQTPQTVDHKELPSSTEIKLPSAVAPVISMLSSPSSLMEGSSGGPLKTMIFENRNFKSVSNSSSSGKDGKDNSLGGLELTKDIGLGFGKDTGSDGMDFGSPFEDHNKSSYQGSKPAPIGQNRNFQHHHHQPSPVSPMAKDLTEKIQSVRQVWEKPSMPSVTEQTTVGSEDTNNFHSGFSVADSFKTDTSRDFGTTLQQSQTVYSHGVGSSGMSAISKPDSSTSPGSAAMRQMKSQQQSSMENHVGMSSSPFAYSMPQHQSTPFGGPSAIPSPPTGIVYGSQPLSAHTGVYQAFPHVDTSQVLNTTARNQYGQFSGPQGSGGTPYGLNSIFMTSMDTSYQPLSSYQHSHHPQHSQSGQAPSATNRSPGPMSTSVGSNTSGVMTSMKSQSSGYPTTPHQVIGAPSQGGYSQMSHHPSGGMPHHAIQPVGHPSKPNAPGGYTQSGMTTQSQIYIPYDPSQQVLNFGGQNFVSSNMRNAPPTGPPPSATPPVQGIQQSSSFYSGNGANQVFPQANQGSGLQQLHVAVAPNPQALQNLQTATQQYGQQFQLPYSQLQGYNQQAGSAVSALNLGGQLIRPPSHSQWKGMEMVQQSHSMKQHEPMMNPTWNAQGFPLNQGFHSGGKPGGNNPGPNIGNQRKGNHPMSSMQNMGPVKYGQNSNYAPQQKGGRYPAPGPIQRPVSTSPSTSMASVGMRGMNKHMNQPGSGMEEGLLDKLITEGHNRSISGTPDPKVIMSNPSDHSGTESNLTISSANANTIGSSEK